MGTEALTFQRRVGGDEDVTNTALEETLWPPPKVSRTSDASKPTDEATTDDKGGIEQGSSTAYGKSNAQASTIIQTDSGRTITVPNSEIVTVTRHTLIITDKPPPLSTSSSTATLTTPIFTDQSSTVGSPSTETSSAPDDAGQGHTGLGISTGGIVGVGIAGALLISAFITFIFFLKRRRKRALEKDDSTDFNAAYGANNVLGEKHFSNQVSPQTTGTRSIEDPFAPFGGRADKPKSEYPTPPNDNAFEMDGTSTAPCELPDTSPSACKRDLPDSRMARDLEEAGTSAKRIDPLANLNQLGQDAGKPRYINHWNQYKAMSTE